MTSAYERANVRPSVQTLGVHGKVEVKYDHSFDPNSDTYQMGVKNVMALLIHLILDKEGKCDLYFDSIFDARQKRNQISYGFAMHLIPVKVAVKHVNNFDSSFDAC